MGATSGPRTGTTVDMMDGDQQTVGGDGSRCFWVVWWWDEEACDGGWRGERWKPEGKRRNEGEGSGPGPGTYRDVP